MASESRGAMLVIGARGFTGRHLTRIARESGFGVIAASHRPGADLICDLTDTGSLRDALRSARPDFVVNVAAVSRVGTSWSDPATTLKVNAIGVANLLEAIAAEAPDAHLLCVSSGEVYGSVLEEEIPVTESQRENPINPYGASKVAMEMFCRAHARASERAITIVRAFNQIGPGQADTFAASSFARQIAAAERRESDEVEMHVGNLSAARDFTDVRDTARAYLLLLQSQLAGTFNCCSGRPVRLESVIELLQTQTPLTIRIESDPDLARRADMAVTAGSNERLREATRWEPEIPLERTLADLLDWWRAQPLGAS